MAENDRDLREYGLGNYTKFIVGRPRLASVMAAIDGHEAECPHCHIRALCEIEVVMKNMPLMTGPFGVGRYLSCPACPWASPMLIVSVQHPPTWLEE